MRVVTEQNFPRLNGFCVAYNRQLRAAQAFEVTLQFLGRVTFGGGRIVGDHDAVSAFASFSEDGGA